MNKILIVSSSLPTKSFPRDNIFAQDETIYMQSKGYDVYNLILHRIYLERINFWGSIRKRISQFIELWKIDDKKIEKKFYFSFPKPFVIKEDLFLFSKPKKNNKFSLIIVHFALHTGLNIKWLRKHYPNAKIVIRVHSDWSVYNKLIQKLINRKMKEYDEIWLVNNELRKNITDTCSKKIKIIEPIFYKNTKKIHKNYNIYSFLTVANLVKVKGFDKMIDFFSKFDKINENWNWKIIGKGNEKDMLINWIKHNNFENKVNIIPEITKNKVLNEYKKFNYYIQLSYNETFGVAPIEAYYFDCKVIVSENIPSINQLSPKKNIIFYSNPKEVIGKIIGELI